MRTTVAIDDEILYRAKQRARARGVSLGMVIEDALRSTGDDDPIQRAPEIPVFHGSGVRPGIDLSSTRNLLDQLDEGVDLNKRR